MITSIDPASIRPPDAAALPDAALEEINRLWTIVRAFSNTAHDVNNDLQVIAGNAELLEGRDLDPVVRRRVQAIREQAAAAAATINRLLSYSRANAGAPTPVDVCEIVAAAVAMRRASLNRARIAITIDAGSGPCWVVADGRRTLQAVMDLLLAAEEVVRHGPEGRISVTVQHTPVAVSVSALADAGGAPEPESPGALATASVTLQAQLWAAAHLARTQGGTLSAASGDGDHGWTLRLPALQPGS